MEIDDFRWSALARYHDAATESGMLLLALSRMPIHSHFDARFLFLNTIRPTVRLMTEATTFAANARKAIEIASVIDPTIIANARQAAVHAPGERIKVGAMGEEAELTNRSLWWCLSRIIHSVRLWVVNEHTLGEVTERRVYSHDCMRTLGVSSDLDGASSPDGWSVDAEVTHYIGVDGLVGAYSWGLSLMIEAAIAKKRDA